MFSQWCFCRLNVVLTSKIRCSSKNNWTDCNLFITLPIRLKACRFNGVFLTFQDVRARKIGRIWEVLRAWARPISIVRAIFPGLGMLLYFHRINEISSQVSFKLFVKHFWKQLFSRTPLRGVFRTQSNIYDRAFLWK